jgi:pyruvate,water dikinase
LLAGIQALARADAGYWFGTALAVGTAKVTDGLLDGFLKIAAPGRTLTSGRFSRGFHSRTLEAQTELEQIAARVRSVEALRQTVLDASVDQLWARLVQVPGSGSIVEALEAYLARYGHQIHTLDFAAPTLVDDPLPVLVGLKNLVIDPGVAVRMRQAELARERDALIESTAASFDPVRRTSFLRLVALAQRFGPYREESLFYLGLGWPKLREMALALGQRLVDVGTLQAADEIFYLRTDEIRTAIVARTGNQGLPELATLAQKRRSLQQKQAELHPPPAVPPTYGLKLGPFDLSNRESQKRNQTDGPTLTGFAVSPGVVRGPAVVMRSSADFHRMTPGAILVCPITTPAWTPLLGQAGGLVTDMGGVLAHGSIVAREYGIPAVLGTGVATQRIRSGQTIQVDGDQGIVTVGEGSVPRQPI